VASEIHMLVKNAHDQDAVPGLAVENRVAGGFDLSVTGADVARIAPEVGKFGQPLESVVQILDLLFSVGEAPSLQ
jgi:hypothetical protein